MLAKIRQWLLPAALMLFLAEILLFPLAVGVTYAGRREAPDHLLTYRTGHLTWDRETPVDATGTARLDLFHRTYQNVQAQDGSRVVAPGTEETCVARLKNETDAPVRYVAVLYCDKPESRLPVSPALAGNNLADTAEYPLPEGVTAAQVVRAVTGTVRGGEIQDFDIQWNWAYSVSPERDDIDTALGNKAAWQQPDTVTAGLYIVVEEDGTQLAPAIPQTGDSGVQGYLVLLVISGAVLLQLLWERKGRQTWQNR